MNSHAPVMLKEMLEHLKPHANGRYVDFTYGCGGYSKAIYKLSEIPLFAIDRDPNAIEIGKNDPSVNTLHARFSDLKWTELPQFDGAVADLGVSSPQIDDPTRGFSFQKSGPLDMRMGLCEKNALQLIRTTNAEDLAEILKYYGEEPHARRVAKAIFQARNSLESTIDLAKLVASKTSHPTKHPATRTFQALRIAINNELEEISILMENVHKILKKGARMLVTTFHSLEDRIVKLELQKWPEKGKIMPTSEEIIQNPRARSAKIRWGTNG